MHRVRDGFTLVELIVVLFILGLAATFAAPRIDITKFRVNSAVQSLGTTMLAAQRQAVTQQHDIVVLFDTTAHLLRIHEDRNNDGAVGTGEHVRPVTLACAGMNPPPYFPTTGHFVRGHYYEVEPVNFNIDTYWQRLIPHK